MSPLHAVRASLVRASRRYSRVAHEVEDLAHDLVVSALRRGLALDGDVLSRSADGAARRHAAFLARTSVRRRSREARAELEPSDEAPTREVDGATPLAGISPSLRTTLLLLAQGLDKAELRHVLGLTDAALRKRFQALRDMAPLARPDLPPAPSAGWLRRSQLAILRKVAERAAAAEPVATSAGNTASASGRTDGAEGVAQRALGASDPDGHGIFFAEVLTPERRAATPSPKDAPAPARSRSVARRTPPKEAPC